MERIKNNREYADAKRKLRKYKKQLSKYQKVHSRMLPGVKRALITGGTAYYQRRINEIKFNCISFRQTRQKYPKPIVISIQKISDKDLKAFSSEWNRFMGQGGVGWISERER